VKENAPPPTAPEAAAFLLREYCEHREHFRMFEDFDVAVAAMQHRLTTIWIKPESR
jgi:hypothetical protein